MNLQNQGSNWPNLNEKLLTQLRNLGYKDVTLRKFRSGLKRILSFMEIQNYTVYTEKVGVHYISEWTGTTKPPIGSERFIKTVINRLNDILMGKEYISRHSFKEKIFPECFSKQANQYLDYLQQRGMSKTSIRIRKNYCFEFLDFLVGTGVYTLEEIKATHVYDGFSLSRSKSSFYSTARSFLKFSYEYGYQSTDLSVFVPKPRPAQPIPSVYSEEEINKLFSSIDTTTNIGKRDYAILSFAALLGLRRSDIGNLTLSNIDFRSKMIRIVQQKTGIPMEIEMLSDVEDALLSYLTVRGTIERHEQIFLSEKAPHRPLLYNSICSVAQKRFQDAGINIAGKKHGTHALRMSLATQLISEDVPYSVTQKILGQTDPKSTKHYVRIDVEKLRCHALDVPPPIGLFAERLGLTKGGSDDAK